MRYSISGQTYPTFIRTLGTGEGSIRSPIIVTATDGGYTARMYFPIDKELSWSYYLARARFRKMTVRPRVYRGLKARE